MNIQTNQAIWSCIVVGIVAGCLGWRYHKAFVWNFIDVLYYPLAAGSVILLFLSSDIQREMLEHREKLGQQELELASVKSKEPKIKITEAGELLTVQLSYIKLIASWGDTCKRGSSGEINPRCFVVDRLLAPVQTFMTKADARYPNYGDRLFGICMAGTQMIDSIRASGALPSYVMEGFAQQWNAAAAKKLTAFDVESFHQHRKQFEEQATAYGAKIHAAIAPPEADKALLLEGINKADVEFGGMLFAGLSQCITAPQKDLATRKAWVNETTSREKEVANSRDQLAILANTKTKNLWSQQIQLNLWPFVLLFALALKFAKGVAGFTGALESRYPNLWSGIRSKISAFILRSKEVLWRWATKLVGVVKVHLTR